LNYQRNIRIPKDRVGAIIGRNGNTKEEIEKKFKIDIVIDSEYGDVTLSSQSNDYDILDLNKAMEIVNAISKGFSPERAFELFSDENVFEIIDLRSFTGKSENKMIRIKSRIIGEHGKSRRTIEELTGTYISVYGHNVSIIGASEHINLAAKAINMICLGKSHKIVYNFLQEIKRKAKLERMKLWE
jgi:ribosomal RNA assembly protein